MSWRSERIDGRATTYSVELFHPLTDKAEVELGLQVAVEVGPGNQILKRDGDRGIEAAGLVWAEHGVAPRREVAIQTGERLRV
jgi:hypothetical protein